VDGGGGGARDSTNLAEMPRSKPGRVLLSRFLALNERAARRSHRPMPP